MKYIKTYEENNENIFAQEYEVGDYVVAHKNRFMGRFGDYLADKVAPIIRITLDDLIDMEYNYYLQYDLTPEITEFYSNTKGVMFFSGEELRPATSEEIEQYELEHDIKKYNL